MFVLLNRLQRLRRDIALPAPARRGSIALRHVDAGSCNGCEHELTAAANPFYDLQRFGLVAALGDCAVLGAGAFAHPEALADPLESLLPVDLYIPGCPPAPDRIADALTGALDLLRTSAATDRTRVP
jgi:Ni,Fe-hydrogenase III small subunit